MFAILILGILALVSVALIGCAITEALEEKKFPWDSTKRLIFCLGLFVICFFAFL